MADICQHQPWRPITTYHGCDRFLTSHLKMTSTRVDGERVTGEITHVAKATGGYLLRMTTGREFFVRCSFRHQGHEAVFPHDGIREVARV